MFRPLPEGAGADRPVFLLPVPRVRLRRDVAVRSRFSRAPFRGRGGDAGEAAGIRGGTREGGPGSRGGGRVSASVRARGTQVPRNPLPQALPPRGALRLPAFGGEAGGTAGVPSVGRPGVGHPRGRPESPPPVLEFPRDGPGHRALRRGGCVRPRSPGSRRSLLPRGGLVRGAARQRETGRGRRPRRPVRTSPESSAGRGFGRFPAHGIRDPPSSRGTSSSSPRTNRCPRERRGCGTARSRRAGRFFVAGVGKETATGRETIAAELRTLRARVRDRLFEGACRRRSSRRTGRRSGPPGPLCRRGSRKPWTPGMTRMRRSPGSSTSSSGNGAPTLSRRSRRHRRKRRRAPLVPVPPRRPRTTSSSRPSCWERNRAPRPPPALHGSRRIPRGRLGNPRVNLPPRPPRSMTRWKKR